MEQEPKMMENVANMVQYGKEMRKKGWKVNHDSQWPNIIWTSPRGEVFNCGMASFPSIEAIQNALKNNDIAKKED